MRSLRAVTRAFVLAALIVPGFAPLLHAQEPERGPHGWLGVRINDWLQCEWEAETDRKPCARVLVVQEVMVDGPADRAGVEPGDRLVAIDGHTLDDPKTRMRHFANLRAGDPAWLSVGRDGDEQTLQVVPVRRPSNLAAVAWRGGQLTYRSDAYVLPLKPLTRLRDSTVAVTIRTDDEGVLVVRPGRISIDGEDIVLVELENLTVDVTRALEEAGSKLAQVELGTWLKALQDSVFVNARVQLDSLRKLMLTEKMRENALEWSLRRARDGGVVTFGRHLAGAEFKELGGELAEAFEGVDKGLLVLRVLPRTPAAKVGLRPGDVVTNAGGQQCESLSDLRAALRHGPKGGPLTIQWVRRGRQMEGILKGE
jgi:membrane-associated protease RseP (regulator of RpoE activity)